MNPDLSVDNYKSILLQGKQVSMEEAIFRSEKAFKPSNLKEHYAFWEEVILKYHPNKSVLLKWLSGVRIEDFLQSFTEGEFQLNSLIVYFLGRVNKHEHSTTYKSI